MDSFPPKPKATRIVGLDYGLARIGVSLSDERKIIATPLTTIKAEKQSARTAVKVLKELAAHQEQNRYAIEEIIVGLPLLLSGKSGLLADEVMHFIEHLKKLTSIPIRTWDERLTTVQAERSLNESSLTRKRRSQVVDSVTAIIILQSYLDHKSLMNNQER